MMFEQNYKKSLDVQLGSKEFGELFKTLKSKSRVLRLYPTIEALCDLLKPNNKQYEAKDEVMTILMNEMKHSNIIYPLINLMFWSSLSRLYRQRYNRVCDPEALFSRIQWDFYQTLINHNLERLPRKIDVNIFLNTKKKVIAWEKENIRYKDAIRELGELSYAGISAVDIDESIMYPEEIKTYLLEILYRKVINKIQYDLIIETLVLKKVNQREWARNYGISYNTARSMKYRAKMAIKAYEQKREMVLE